MYNSHYLRFCVQDNKNILIPLQSEELQYFRKFIRKIHLNKNIKRLYRGMNLEATCNRLGIYDDDEKLSNLADRLFMLGEKSRYFLQNIPNIKMQSCSWETFCQIFNALSNETLLMTNNFYRKNEDFCEFFLDKGNIDKFIYNFNDADNKERFIIRNYYLALLHQLACSAYQNYSLHVSTTEDINVARKFALHKSNGIILFCWSQVKYLPEVIKQYNMPIYDSAPFEEEREDSHFAAIFPHFIYGVQIINSNNFIINHHMFTDDNRNIENSILYSGIKINQSDFLEYLKKTTYKTYGTKIKDEYNDYSK